MKQIIIFLGLLALSGGALATSNQNHECQGGHNCNTYETGGGGHNEQGQSQDQRQSQGQSQGQTQSAEANAASLAISESNASANNSNSNESSNVNLNVAEGGQGGQGGNASSAQANSQSTNLTFEGSGKADHYNKYGNNVGIAVPAIYSSSACTGGGLSGGASAFGMGIALGGAKQDIQCQVRENARILASLNPELSLIYLCANPTVDIGQVLGAACKPTPAAPIVVPEKPQTQIPTVVLPVETDVKG